MERQLNCSLCLIKPADIYALRKRYGNLTKADIDKLIEALPEIQEELICRVSEHTASLFDEIASRVINNNKQERELRERQSKRKGS